MAPKLIYHIAVAKQEKYKYLNTFILNIFVNPHVCEQHPESSHHSPLVEELRFNISYKH